MSPNDTKRKRDREATPRKRPGIGPNPQLARPDLPYTMKLPDGRTLFVEVPGRYVTEDRGGEPALRPDGVRFLDRVRALAMSGLDRPPSPGYLVALREGLGLLQREFAERVGVDKMTVSRWERGTLRPSPERLKEIEKLRREATARGVVLPG